MTGRLRTLERRGEVQLELRPEDVSSGVSISSLTVFSSEPPTLLTHTSRRPNSATVRSGQLLGEVADVCIGDQRALPSLDDTGGGLLEVAPSTGVDNDIAAGVGQPPGDGPADPLAGSRDDGDPTVHAEPIKQAHASPIC